MRFKPFCLPTAIGSVPHIDPREACKIILENFKEIPPWPQLPNRSFLENMYVQYTEGMPCVVIDKENRKIYFDLSKQFDQQVEDFYQRYLSDDLESFSISRRFASGFYSMLEALKESSWEGIKFIKGQITGPVSFGLTVTDEDKKPLLYNELMIDVIVKSLSMKLRWQEKELNKNFPKTKAIIFFDEPYLMSYGSAFVSLDREAIIGYLRELKNSIKGLSGVHCCGNTDWSLFTEAGVDIISFDAYDYTEKIALYPSQLKSFIKKGGILAWGIVPSSFPTPNQIAKEDLRSLVKKFEEKVGLFVSKGFDKDELFQNALVTPNCGTGSMPQDLAEKTLKLTREVSDEMRRKYKLA